MATHTAYVTFSACKGYADDHKRHAELGIDLGAMWSRGQIADYWPVCGVYKGEEEQSYRVLLVGDAGDINKTVEILANMADGWDQESILFDLGDATPACLHYVKGDNEHKPGQWECIGWLRRVSPDEVGPGEACTLEPGRAFHERALVVRDDVRRPGR